MVPHVLGIDPGARYTGVVVRYGNDLINHGIIEVAKDRERLSDQHVRSLLDTIQLWLCERPIGPHATWIVAVEGVNEPVPHMGTISVRHLLGTAVVYGAVLAADWTAYGEHGARVVTVPPGRNGAGMLATYPEELVTDAERRKGLNRPAGDSALIRHCRSAWDVAGVGARIARTIAA